MNLWKVITVTGLTALLLLNSIGCVFAQDEESFVRESVVSKRDAVILSLLFPGLGQMTQGQKVKGVTFFMAEAVSLVLFFNSHETYNTKVKTYERDLNVFNNVPLSGSGKYNKALSTYNDLKNQSDDLDNLHTIRNTALAVAAGVYAYSLIDALIFSPSTSESRRAENLDNKLIVKSAIIDSRPGIMISKRF